MATYILMSKSYRASGRPNGFQLVEKDDIEEIERLSQGFGYVIEEEVPESYTVSRAWDDLTYQDSDGFAQWKR